MPKVEVGDDRVLKLSGDLLFSTVVTLRDELLQTIASQGQGTLILDMAGVQRVDSSALSLWLCCQRQAKSSGGEVTIRNLPSDMRSIADLVGLDDYLH
ncbi:STAS domain-containing protein [Nitrincola alkalilacustris]|uniref:STAS domain-containing protein n=1 Tax=Nitrincola alkalilacustris TaxID=1571224 RepID=UPI0014572A0A|nr:STAS domain-containing protein [Nitrincola alkalilacustris]